MSGADLQARLNALPPEQREQLKRLLAARHASSAPRQAAAEPRIRIMEPIPRAPAAADYALSFAQQRLWVQEQLAEGKSAPYNLALAVFLHGDVSIGALESACRAVISRNAVLRTRFVRSGGELRQQVLTTWEWRIEQWTGAEGGDGALQFRQRAETEANRPFALEQELPIRVACMRLGERCFGVSLVLHHIACDGGSIPVLLDDLRRDYTAARQGDRLVVQPEPSRYVDYARWHRAWMQRPEGAVARAYWLREFADLPEPLELPADFPRPAVQDFAGRHLHVRLPATLRDQLVAVGQRAGASLFMVLQAGVAAFLSRYAGQDDLTIGAPTDGRIHPDLERQVGLFVNTMALRIRVNPHEAFTALLNRVRDRVLDAFEHQGCPFDVLVDALHLARDLSRPPLFNVMMGLTHADDETLRLPGVESEPVPLALATSKVDLTFHFVDSTDGLALDLEYATALFTEDRIRRLAAYFETLLGAVGAAAETVVGDLPLMDPARLHPLIASFNPPRREYPRDRSLTGLFRDQVRQTPAAAAVYFDGREFSYAEIDRLSDRIAGHLVERLGRLKPEEPIALQVDRSERMIAALLGILKAGGCYLPINPGTPAERVRTLLTLGGVRLRLVESEPPLGDWAGTDAPLGTWCEGAPRAAFSAELASASGSRALAYIIFTSGSTGAPKGVLVEQRSVVRLVRDTDFLQLRPGDRVLQTGSLAFDASTFEIWGPLLNGGCCCLPRGKEMLEIADFGALLEKTDAKICFLTTGLFNQIAEYNAAAFRHLRTLLTGGEKVSVSHVERVLAAAPELDLLHVYGPTENTTFSSWHRVRRPVDRDVPIGRAIAHSSLYVLDRRGNLLPPGVPGEIFCGGDGLARGYLGQPDFTAERFVPDACSGQRGARLYRTGDFGAWDPSGQIEFIGRRDDQVKVRGFRIELGEIELRLRAISSVQQAVVVARPAGGTHELVAYIVAGPEGSESVLRAALAKSLPDYMVPSHFVFLAQLPLNANGKVDRRALPPPERKAPADAVRAGRIIWTNPGEGALAAAWQEVLGRPPDGRESHYFNSGGDSIKAIQMSARLRHHGYRLSLREVFARPHFADMASALQPTESAGPEDAGEGEVPLTPIQRWFVTSFAPPYDHFNQATWFECTERVDADALRRALALVVERHAMLRCSVRADATAAGGWSQRVGPVGTGTLVWRDIDERASQPAEARAQSLAVAQELQRSLSLADGRLLAVGRFRGSQADRLLVIIHHWAVDGISWRILLEDLESIYRCVVRRQAVPARPPTASFRAWAQALQRLGRNLDREVEYWQTVSARAPHWKLDQAKRIDVARTTVLSAELTAQLLGDAHRAYGTQVPDLLLAALGRAWSDAGGGDALLLAMEGHGRESEGGLPEVNRTVGWFTSLWPFLLEAHGDWPDRIREIKDARREVPARGFGYGVFRYLGERLGSAPPDDLSAPRVSFNYLGEFAGVDGGLFHGLPGEPSGDPAAAHLQSPFALDVVGEVVGGQLRVTFHFHRALFGSDGCAALVDRFTSALVGCVQHAIEAAPRRSRSDFTGAIPTLSGLDRLLAAAAARDLDAEDLLPLTPMQEGMVAHALSSPLSVAYADQVVLRLTGSLEPRRFEQAWQALGTQYPNLRIVFFSDETGKPLGLVARRAQLGFTWIDATKRNPEAEDPTVALQQADRERGFDLARGPLLRMTLVRLGSSTHVAIIGFHHSILDGWSSGLLWQSLEANYRALEAEQPLPRVSASFRDYLRWLRGRSATRDVAEWRTVLADCAPGAVVPPGAPRLGAGAIRTRSFTWDFGRERTAWLVDGARRLGTTENSLFQALWGVFLGKLTGRTDVVFGATVSGRHEGIPHVEAIVGLLINTVPVRVRWQPQTAFRELAANVHEQAAGSLERVAAALGDIQAAVLESGALIQHTVVFENYPADDDAGAPAHAWRSEIIAVHDPMHFEFGVLVVPRREGWTCRIIADETRYPDAYLRELQHAWEDVLDGCLRRPELAIDSWPLAHDPGRSRAIVVAATFTAEPIADALNFWNEGLGYATELRFAPFNQVLQQVLDARSELHRNRSGFNLLLVRLEDWLGADHGDAAAVDDALTLSGDQFIDGLRRLADSVAATHQFVLFCPPSPATRKNSVLTPGLATTEARLVRRIAAISPGRIQAIASVELAAACAGFEIDDPAGENLGAVPYTAAFFAAVATIAVRHWEAVTRPPLKVLALDADNTLWQGVIGEDGPAGVVLTPGHRRLQLAAKSARDHGQLLALVSKNNVADLRDAFARRDDFPLRWEDFAAVEAGWRPKSDALRDVARRLNLGLDSVVFLDDSTLECAEVRAAVPEVLTLQVPESAGTLDRFVGQLWALDVGATTAEDRRRGELYQAEARREESRRAGGGIRAFIRELQLEVCAIPVGPANLARAAQLTQRTNQFNASTKRRTEAEIATFIAQPGNRGFVVAVKDRFGDYGLTGLVLHQSADCEWNVDTFLLSCRVLGRGVEHEVLRQLATEAAAAGIARLRVAFERTPRNAPAEEFLRAFAIGEDAGALLFEVAKLLTIEVADESVPLATAHPEVTPRAVASTVGQPAASAFHQLVADELGSIPGLLHALAEWRLRQRRRRPEGPYEAPRDERERTLAAIWAEVLGVERVGRGDSFFALGGHSLPAVMMLSRVTRAFGVDLPLDSVFSAPVFADFAARIDAAPSSAARGSAILPAAPAPDYPLSHAQRRLWLMEQMRSAGPSPFHMTAVFRVAPGLDLERLQRAFQRLLERHEALRTGFVLIEGEPRQVVRTACRFAIEQLLPRGHDREEAAAVAELVERPFDLAQAPLLRVGALHRHDGYWTLAVVMHHLVSDGWSIGVMADELAGWYRDPAANPAPLSIQYKDFAVWQAKELSDGALRRSGEFWRAQFASLPPPLDLPADRLRPAAKQSCGREVHASCPASTWAAIKRQAQEEGLSPFMAVLAVLQLLLGRHARSRRFVIGTPVAARDRPELEPQIGFYVNLLPIIADLSPAGTVREHFGRVRQSVTSALNHAGYPFDRLVDDLDLPRDLSRTPLFDVLLVFQTNRSAELALDGVEVRPEERPATTSQYDVTFELAESADGLRLRLEYDVALYDAPRMQRLANGFMSALAEVLATPLAALPTLALCPDAEMQVIRSFERGTQFGTSVELPIPALLAPIVAAKPRHPAIVVGDEPLTYGELDAWSQTVATRVRAVLGRPGVVAVAGQRGADFIVTMLGVMRAGCCYLPLELKHPDERLKLILEDGEVRHAVAVGTEARARLANLGLEVIDIGAIDPSDAGSERPVVSPDDIAYVIYTSGSTGKPKGVEVTHRAFATMITAQTEAFGVRSTDRCAWWASCAFDASLSEIFLGLVTGATVVVAEEAEREDPDRFVAWLRRQSVTVATLPPAFLRVLNRAVLAPLRVLITAGEAADPADACHYATQLEYLNAYGPTETAVCATVHVVRPGSLGERDRRVPIGKPLSVAATYVLDEERRRVPLGVAGELYVAGQLVARGYRNAPTLTAAQFVADSLAPESGGRMYRTGDLVRWRDDGVLEFLGRVDRQVKIRGFRIELAEIEAAIRAVPAIRDVAVVALDRPTGSLLVAYLVGAAPVDVVRARVAVTLPDYMRPSTYVSIPRLPMNSSGKLDQAALPPPTLEMNAPVTAPEGQGEQLLAEAWRECLGVEEVGRESDFFALGGESIKALRLVAAMRLRGWSLGLKTVFSFPRLLAQAAQLTPLVAAPVRTLDGPTGLLPIQHWFLEAHGASPLHHFNQAVYYRVTGRADVPRLSNAIAAVWRHHASLRAVFERNGDTWRQVLRPATTSAPELARLDLTAESAAGAAAREAAWVKHLQESFDLGRGPLIRYGLIHGATADRVLCITHHLVSDWVSHRILLDDLNTAYAAPAMDALVLRPGGAEIDEWVAASLRWASSRAAREGALPVWKALVQSMPASAGHRAGRYGDVTPLARELDDVATARLLAAIVAIPGATIRDALIAAIARAERDIRGEQQTVLQLEGHGRDGLPGDLDASRTVGWFTSLYPFAIETRPGETEAATLVRVRDGLSALPDSGVSFGRLRAYAPEAGLPPAPTRMGLNYLGEFAVGKSEAVFQLDDELPHDAIAREFERDHAVDVSAWIFRGRLNVQLAFMADQIPVATMTRWLDRVIAFLTALR